MRIPQSIIILGSAILLSTPARATSTVIHKYIAPGVELVQTIIPASDPGGPELIHELIVDPRVSGVHFQSALGGGTVEEAGGGREAVQKTVARTGALAGINADFFGFDAGDPYGLMIRDGELVSETFHGRAGIGIRADGSAIIGAPEFKASVVAADGQSFPIAGLNRKAAPNELVVYSAIYGERALDKPLTGAVLDVGGAVPRAGVTLKATVDSQADVAGIVRAPSGRLLLAGLGDGAVWIKQHIAPGSAVHLTFSLADGSRDWSKVSEAVAGNPAILENGKPAAAMVAQETGSFSTTHHPRSAVGITANGKILLVAVDGRQILSRGMTLPELADEMKSLGARDAVNLDGGGSTTLSVRGLIINSPSDGEGRKVADSLLVFTDTDAHRLNVGDYMMSNVTVAAGETKPISMGVGASWGRDPSYVFGNENGGVFVDQAGNVSGYKAGLATAKVITTHGQVVAAFNCIVTAGHAGRLTTTWKDGNLRITVTDANGNAVSHQEIELKRADGAELEVLTDTKGVAAPPAGWLADEKTGLTLTAGPLSKTWPPAPEKDAP